MPLTVRFQPTQIKLLAFLLIFTPESFNELEKILTSLECKVHFEI